MDEPTCSIDGCDKPVRAYDWCGMHAQRWRRHGDPNFSREKLDSCSVDDCDGKPRGRGLCEKHYTRWLRHGDLEVHHPAIKSNGEVNYFTLHERLRKARGSAADQACAGCGTPAAQWAQLHGEDPCNFDSYVPMCHSCHRKYDTYPETREKNRRNGGSASWTPERRAEHSRKMTEWWAARKQRGSHEDM
jgi:hypothetical protein